MANIGHRWKRLVAVACSHGDFIHPQSRKDVLDFCKRFNPYYRLHLGDAVDTACFRSGAPGTKDEARSPRDDISAAISFFEEYCVNYCAWGNHDWRLYVLQTHPKAIVSTLAGEIWTRLNNCLRKLKAKTVPYDIKYGWFELGGVFFGHGYMFSENALKAHVSVVGGSVVIGHLHYPHQICGRTIKDTPSFCVGALANDEQLTYGRRRAACLSHGPGVLFGEVSDVGAKLWLARSENGKPVRFPPGI